MTEVTICYGLTESSPVMTQTRFDEPDLARKCTTVGRAMPGVEVAVIAPETGADPAPGPARRTVLPGLPEHGGLLQPARGDRRLHRRQRLAAFRGHRHHGRPGLLQGHRPAQGHDHPRRGEHLPQGSGGVPASPWRASRTSRWWACRPTPTGRRWAPSSSSRPGRLGEGDIQDFCRGRIARHKIPRYIAFVTAYPMTASGKIQKFKLREDASSRWPQVR